MNTLSYNFAYARVDAPLRSPWAVPISVFMLGVLSRDTLARILCD